MGVVAFVGWVIISIPMLQIISIVVFFRDTIFLPLWVRINKFLVLCICRFVFVHIERIKVDVVLWLLISFRIFFPIVASHPKKSACPKERHIRWDRT